MQTRTRSLVHGLCRESVCATIAVSVLVIAGCGAGKDEDTPAQPEQTDCPAMAESTSCPCGQGEACYQGRCYMSAGACDDDADCLDDMFCDGTACIPFREDTQRIRSSCRQRGEPFPATQFSAPVLKCGWTESSTLGVPVLIDLDKDKNPEIVFVASTGELIAISGIDCSEVFRVATDINYTSSLSAGDIDGDGEPEIVGITLAGEIVVHAANGAFVTRSEDAAKLYNNTDRNGGVALVNLTSSLGAEMVSGGLALEFDGSELKTLFNVKAYVGGRGALASVADVDLDGVPEIVIGNAILDATTGVDKTPDTVAVLDPGYPAIADFDPAEPGLEVALVSSSTTGEGTLTVYNPVSGKILFGPYTASSKAGGPPVVVDVDADGVPEIGIAGYDTFTLFDLECAELGSATCAAAGIRWRGAIRDISSGVCSASAFDLNGDGTPEILSRDECWLRAFDGDTGTVRFATTVTSATTLEYPIVGDVDGDGHAEIVVTSDGSMTDCEAEAQLGLEPGEPTQGVLIFEDAEDRWQPARAIWNQHTYHVTNVDDDGTVPDGEVASAELVNSFREQVALAPDLTARASCASTGEACLLQGEVCNRGTSAAAGGATATFYDGDPRDGGAELCSATVATVDVGACVAVECEPEHSVETVWLGVDVADGGECETGNNYALIGPSGC